MTAPLDVVAPILASTVDGGPAHGCRALDLRVLGGIDLRLLPRPGARRRRRLVRRDPVRLALGGGGAGAARPPRDADWLDAFGGGLVTTCGLRNVGAASEGHGLHGRISHVRAGEVATRRERTSGRRGRRHRRRRARRGLGAGPAPAARAHDHHAHGLRLRRDRRPDDQPGRHRRAGAAALPRQPRGAAARAGDAGGDRGLPAGAARRCRVARGLEPGRARPPGGGAAEEVVLEHRSRRWAARAAASSTRTRTSP